MANYSELVNLVISKAGYAQPVTGGDNPVSDAEIIEYLNDAFAEMTKQIKGHEKYVRFTITAAGVIAITEPALPLPQPTISLVTPALVSLPSYKISDAYRIIQVENMTANMINTYDRVLYRIPYDQRRYALAFEDSDTYYRWVDGQARRGIVLLPKTITAVNDLAVTYGGRFTRYAVPAFTFTGTGVDNATLGGIYTGTDNIDLHIEIDGTAPDAFRWSIDGGVTWENTGVLLVAGAYTLGTTGLTLTWGTIILGHIVGDTWESAVIVPSLSYFEEEEQREYPVEYAAAMTMKDLKQVEWAESYGFAIRYLAKYLRNRESEDMESYYSMEE